MHEARSVCLKKYGASQHEAFGREGHNRVKWQGTLARKPFVTQLFLQHVSSPFFDVEFSVAGEQASRRSVRLSSSLLASGRVPVML
jgi:hypothetical protein